MADLSHLSNEELLALAAGNPPPQPQSSLAHISDDDLLKMKAQDAPPTPTAAPPEQTPDYKNMSLGQKISYDIGQIPARELAAAKALAHGIGTVVGYPGGISRTALAAAAGAAQGDVGKIVDKEALMRALKGNADTSAKYYQRLGVPAGPSVGVPYFGNVSARDVGGFATDVATDPLLYASKLRQIPGLNFAGEATEAAGNKMYKSGLKRIDQEVAKYGKDPVSDVLMKYRLHGSAESISKQMDDLGNHLLSERNKILKNATAQGAEVDMNEAVKHAQNMVDDMRKINHPELGEAIDSLQSRIDAFKGRAAKESEESIRDLPYTKDVNAFSQNPEDVHRWYEAGNTGTVETSSPTARLFPDRNGKAVLNWEPPRPSGEVTVKKLADQPLVGIGDQVLENSLPIGGEYVPKKEPGFSTAFDEADAGANWQWSPTEGWRNVGAISGPTPIQASSWKTTNANRLSDSAWEKMATTPQGKGFDKALGQGLKEATESSVGRTLGKDAEQALAGHNDELGRVLTADERAAIEANKEINKNAVTSIDAPLFLHNPMLYLAKKGADVAKMTGPRTTGGLMLSDFGKTRIPDAIARQILSREASPDDTFSPWLNMKRGE